MTGSVSEDFGRLGAAHLMRWRRTSAGLVVPARAGPRPVPGALESLRGRAAVFSRLLPGHVVIARRTAAWIWGLDVLPPGVREAEWPVDLLVASGHTSLQCQGSAAPEADLPADQVVEVGGIRVTTLERTALDCARWLPRLEAVAALDQFLRRGVDLTRLIELAKPLARQRNAGRLRDNLAAADRGAQSPRESWSRVIVIDAGLPKPQTQIPVMGPHHKPVFVDLGYEDLRVGLEYDGHQHHSQATDRHRDETRRRWLHDHHGWEIIVADGAFPYRPAPYLGALLTAMLDHGWNPDNEALDKITTHISRLKYRSRYH